MKRKLEYIVLAASGSIYILYNFIVTSFLLHNSPSRTLHIGETFIAEIVAFIPVGLLFIGMMKLSALRKEFFERLTFRTVFIHFLILLLFICIHSAWQVMFNSIIITGAELSSESILADALYFLNLRVLVYLITAGLVTGVNKIKQKENVKLKESELKLKLQKAKLRKFELKLNPEIIYPILSDLKKNVKLRPERGSKMILNLSRQMRILIDYLDEEHIPIERDVRFFESYFENLKLRLEKELILRKEVDENSLKEKIPSIVLLVPLIEKLFFGSYSAFTEKSKMITYKSKISESGLLNLSLKIFPVMDLKTLVKEIKNNNHLIEVRNMLNHYDVGSLTIHPADNTLAIQLNMVSRPLADEKII